VRAISSGATLVHPSDNLIYTSTIQIEGVVHVSFYGATRFRSATSEGAAERMRLRSVLTDSHNSDSTLEFNQRRTSFHR
jgi:hypothetical protein